jgi:hypothetical protein
LTFGKRPDIAAAVLENFDVVGWPGSQTQTAIQTNGLILKRGEAGLGSAEVCTENQSFPLVPRDTLILRPKR